MNLTMLKKSTTLPLNAGTEASLRRVLLSYVLSWELYVIIAIASFLRLYGIGTTEFDADQADIFHMAHNAVSHLHLVATSNVASIGIYNPPATIYFLMIPAAFSANPLWGAVFIAVLAIFSVILTYIFTRRYYGRLAGTIAALLYATSYVAIGYSRFMWNQNLLLLFVPLLIGVLFWGVVEQRKGWLGAAMFLVGLLVQLHGSGFLLAAPLCVALVLAPWKTIRWRDLAYGIVSLLFLYAPYILWMVYTKFRDFNILLNTQGKTTIIDNQALLFYQHFLSPYDGTYGSGMDSATYWHHVLLYGWLGNTMTTLVIAAALVALFVSLLPGKQSTSEGSVQTPKKGLWRGVMRWWGALRSTPLRGGLIILLVWQIVPVLYLSRHSIGLYPHYFIILLPGQFVLVGFFLSYVVKWFQARVRWGFVVRIAVCVLAAFIVLCQGLWTTASLNDITHGRYADRVGDGPNYFNDVTSIRDATKAADQLAIDRHLNRVYIIADAPTQSAFRYLAGQMHTPTTVTDTQCMLLPDPAHGPAVLLVTPYDSYTNDVMPHIVNMSGVSSPKRLSGPPFHLYILNPSPDLHQSTSGETFSHDLQFVDTQSFNDITVTRWNVERSTQPGYHTLYSYNFVNAANTSDTPDFESSVRCAFTELHAGEQLLVPFSKKAGDQATAMHIKAQGYSNEPYIFSPQILKVFSIYFDTYLVQKNGLHRLKTADGQDYITIPTP